MLDIEVDRIQVQVVASLEPGKRFAQSNQMLIALQDHHQSQLMRHQVVSHHFITVFAFTAASVALQLLSLNRFTRLIIVDCDGLHVHLRVVPHQNESTSVDVPPIPALVLDEVADQL